MWPAAPHALLNKNSRNTRLVLPITLSCGDARHGRRGRSAPFGCEVLVGRASRRREDRAACAPPALTVEGVSPQVAGHLRSKGWTWSNLPGGVWVVGGGCVQRAMVGGLVRGRGGGKFARGVSRERVLSNAVILLKSLDLFIERAALTATRATTHSRRRLLSSCRASSTSPDPATAVVSAGAHRREVS